jgi:ABC-type multidrug transport system ATPase subunit
LKKLTEERLYAVRLLAVADQKVSTFSGGMKRRLSVMLATIGDPKVVYLDEVTVFNM